MGGAWRGLRWNIAYWLSRLGVMAGRFLPPRLCYALSAPVADACYLVMARHRRALQANLRRVVGEDEAAACARRVFRNFARYVIDLYQLPSRGQDALLRRVAFSDWQPLGEALDHPNGTLIVTLHLGPAELGGAALSARGHRVNAVAEALGHAPVNRFIQGRWEALGLEIIAAKRARSLVLRCLNRGEVLALMFDNVGGEGVKVDFFGAPAQMSGTPARIALRTGARVLPAVVSRDPADPARLQPAVDFDLRFEPCGDEERDVVALTQAIAASLEGFVRRFPDQWFAFHRVWDEDRPASTEGHERWKHWAILAALKLCRVLPASLSYGLARLAGDVAFWWRSATRRDVEDNMRHVLGENATDEAVRAAAREVFRNVARSYVDLVLLSYKGPRAAFDSLRIEGLEKLTSRLEAGRGVIVTTAHCGNPELAVAVIGASLGIDVLVLVEPLPRSLARVMHRIRSSFGIRYVEVGYTGVAAALRHLRRGGCLAIVSDRDIQDSGAYLTFFGAKARVPLGTVELAARAQVDVLPVFSRRRPGGFDVVFSEPLPLVDSGRPKEDARVNMSALLRRHEEWIRRDPGQWLVLEAIWDGEDAQTPVSAGAGGGPLGPA